MAKKTARHSSDPSALESHLGYWLRYVSNHVSLRFAALAEQEGVSVSEWVALRQIFGKPETSTADLIETLGMTKGAVSKIVSRLEEKKLVRRTANDADRRGQSLSLTATGEALVPLLARLADDNDAAFFSHLPDRQRAELVETLRSIVQLH